MNRSSWGLAALLCVLVSPSAISGQVAPGTTGASTVERRSADELVDQCDQLYWKRDLPHALEACNEAVSRRPNFATAWRDRGAVHYALNEFDKAKADYEKAIELKPRYGEAVFGHGAALYKLGHAEEALHDYNRAIDELRLRDATAYVDRGVVFFDQAKYDDAIADFDKAMRLRKDYALAYADKAKAEYRRHKDGDLAEAKADYDRALTLEKTEEAFYGRGLLYENEGDAAKANDYYRKAVELRPGYYEAWCSLGQMAYNAGDYSDAVADYDKALGVKPDAAEALFGQGLAYQKKGDDASALKDFQAATEHDSNYGEAFYNLGVLHYKNKEYQAAMHDYENARRCKVDSAELSYNLALAYQADNEFGKAIESCDKALQQKQDYGEAYLLRGEARVAQLGRLSGDDRKKLPKEDWEAARKDFNYAIAAKVKETADVYDGRGMAEYGEGDVDAAMGDFRKAMDLSPNDAAVRCHLGAAFYRKYEGTHSRQDLTDAIASYSEAIRLKPEYGEAYRDRGVARLAGSREGYLQEGAAADDLAKARQYGPQDARMVEPVEEGTPEFVRAMDDGYAKYKIKDFEGAIRDYERATELDGNSAKAFNGLGLAWRGAGELGKAEENFSKAIALRPNYGAALLNRAEVRSAKKQWQDALTDFNAGIPLVPGQTLAYEGRGLVKYKLRDWDGAIADFQTAIGKQPDLAAYLGSADARCEKGDWAGAVRDYTEADKIKPGNAAILLDLGFAKYKSYDLAGARKDYDAALAANPKDVPAYYDRGFVRYESDDARGAFGDYDRAVGLRPHGANADDVRGVELGDRKRYKSSQQAFSEAISLKKHDAGEADPDMYFNRAEVKRLRADLAGALKDYDRAIELNSERKHEDGEIYCSRAEARLALKDARAQQDFAKAIELTPKNAAAFYKRAEQRRMRHDFSCAANYYSKAIELNYGDLALAYYGLGISKGGLGDLAGAMEAYNKALATKPDFTGALLNRSQLWRVMGDDAANKKDAKTDYEMAKADFEKARGLSEDAKKVRGR